MKYKEAINELTFLLGISLVTIILFYLLAKLPPLVNRMVEEQTSVFFALICFFVGAFIGFCVFIDSKKQ